MNGKANYEKQIQGVLMSERTGKQLVRTMKSRNSSGVLVHGHVKTEIGEFVRETSNDEVMAALLSLDEKVRSSESIKWTW